MFKGYVSSFLECDSGKMFLRVDTARKIVRKDSVLEQIKSIYRTCTNEGKKELEEKRTAVKSALIGQIIMTNYGKMTFYRIIDIVFDRNVNSNNIMESKTLKEYYAERYGITKLEDSQPLLQVENKIRRRTMNQEERVVFILP